MQAAWWRPVRHGRTIGKAKGSALAVSVKPLGYGKSIPKPVLALEDPFPVHSARWHYVVHESSIGPEYPNTFAHSLVEKTRNLSRPCIAFVLRSAVQAE